MTDREAFSQPPQPPPPGGARLLFWSLVVSHGWGTVVVRPVTGLIQWFAWDVESPERLHTLQRWNMVNGIASAVVTLGALGLAAFAVWRLSRGAAAPAGRLLRVAAVALAAVVAHQVYETLAPLLSRSLLDDYLDPPAWVRGHRIASALLASLATALIVAGLALRRGAVGRAQRAWIAVAVALAVLDAGVGVWNQLAGRDAESIASLPLRHALGLIVGYAVLWVLLIAAAGARRPATAPALDVRPSSARLFAAALTVRAAMLALAPLIAVFSGADTADRRLADLGRVIGLVDLGALVATVVALARSGGAQALRHRQSAIALCVLAAAYAVVLAVTFAAEPLGAGAALAMTLAMIAARAAIGVRIAATAARQLRDEGAIELAGQVRRVALWSLLIVAAGLVLVVARLAGAPTMPIFALTTPITTGVLFLLATAAVVAWRVALAARPAALTPPTPP